MRVRLGGSNTWSGSSAVAGLPEPSTTANIRISATSIALRAPLCRRFVVLDFKILSCIVKLLAHRPR